MTEKHNFYRLYSDLAWLWPMWGDVEKEYADWCNFVVKLINKYAKIPAKSLLDITCGGGKNVFNLRKHFEVTGIDISPVMLKQAKELNPDCEFLQGDMRFFSLEKTFDAILMDDGVSYITNRDDLKAAFTIAFQHLDPGGVLIVGPDFTTETFIQNQTVTTPANIKISPDGVEVIFIENYYDPDPNDDVYEGTMLYLIRENGKLRIETDFHRLGLFPINVWRKTLMRAGFEINENTYPENNSNFVVFSCVKPG